MLSFWRPRAPSGYAIFGDYLTPMFVTSTSCSDFFLILMLVEGFLLAFNLFFVFHFRNEPPTKGVLALNTNIVRVKRPLSYKLVWQSGSPRTNIFHQKDLEDKISNIDQLCSVWLPVAPAGYVAMGCVASSGTAEPPLSSAFCLTASLVSSCNLRDCIALRSNIYYLNLFLYLMYGYRYLIFHTHALCPLTEFFRDNTNMIFWRVDNAFGSFLPGDPASMSVDGNAYDLRHMLFDSADSSSKTVSRRQDSRNDFSQLERSELTSGRLFDAVASFKLIWSNSGTSSPKKLSIWRPMLSEGMFYFGDIAVNGYHLCDTVCHLKTKLRLRLTT